MQDHALISAQVLFCPLVRLGLLFNVRTAADMNPTTAGKLSTSQAPEVRLPSLRSRDLIDVLRTVLAMLQNSVAGLANVDTSKKVEPPKLESKEKVRVASKSDFRSQCRGGGSC